MSTYTEITPSIIDRTIVDIARKAIAGEITEHDARWATAAELTRLDIAGYVAARAANLDQRTRADLAIELQNIIEKKCLKDIVYIDHNDETKHRGLDLARIAEGNTSAAGWARQLARRSVQAALKTVRRVTDDEISVDPTFARNDDMVGGFAMNGFRVASVDGGFDADEIDELEAEVYDISDEFTEAARGTRPSQRLRLEAEAIRNGFKLPELIRPEGMIDREYIRSEIEAEGAESLALDSARAFLSLVSTAESTDNRKIDGRLLSVWDNFTPEDLLNITSLPAKVARLLVLATVSPKTRPSRDVIASALHTIRMCDEDTNTREYQRFTRDLLNAWIASQCAATSDFDTKGADGTDKETQRMADAMAWPALAAEATTRPGQAFGGTVAGVERLISEIIETLNG